MKPTHMLLVQVTGPAAQTSLAARRVSVSLAHTDVTM